MWRLACATLPVCAFLVNNIECVCVCEQPHATFNSYILAIMITLLIQYYDTVVDEQHNFHCIVLYYYYLCIMKLYSCIVQNSLMYTIININHNTVSTSKKVALGGPLLGRGG